MDLQTIQLAAAGALALGYGGYKLAGSRGLPLSGLLAPRTRLAAPRQLLAPSRLRFERITLDATDADLLFFIRRSATLKRLGFQIIGDFTQQALPGTYHRAFVHPERGCYALLIHAPRRACPPCVELHTFFEDGSALTTTDAEERDHPRRPALLRMQRLMGLTLDELYSHHLSNTESLRAKVGPSPEASRTAFFAQYQAALATEAALTRARAPLSGQALARILATLPPVAPPAPETKAILKRYDPPGEARSADAAPPDMAPPPRPLEPPAGETPAPAPMALEPATSDPTPEPMAPEPSLRGIADRLLSRRKALVSEPEVTPTQVSPTQAETTEGETAGFDPVEADPVELAPATPESLPERSFDPHDALGDPIEPPPPELPFEMPAPLPFEPEPAPIEIRIPPPPFAIEEAPAAATRLPFEPEAQPTEEAKPIASLPFEKTSEGKPVCPHCGATVLSSLSSRCNKCKLPLR